MWNAVTPRLGLTYALNENRKTIARASYAMFASQLGATAAGTISAIQYSAIYYYAIDTNGNKIADPNEILLGLGNVGYYGFDPLNPTRLTTDQQDRRIHDAEDARGHVRHRPRADAELRPQQHVHLSQLRPLQLEPACIGVTSAELHADRHA